MDFLAHSYLYTFGTFAEAPPLLWSDLQHCCQICNVIWSVPNSPWPEGAFSQIKQLICIITIVSGKGLGTIIVKQ